MRIIIYLASEKQVVLPFEYNYLLQGAIYHHLPPENAVLLHNRGGCRRKRKFKLFTFSRLMPSPQVDKKGFIFSKKVNLVIASPIDWFIQELAEDIIKQEFLTLGQNKLRVESISILSSISFPERVKIRMLSPITVYSAMENAFEGGKKTYYFSPFEAEFAEQIEANIKKKFEIMHTKICDYPLRIKPLFSGNQNEHILTYKNFIIKAWSGTYELKGRPELIETAYDTGLGDKNSQGFGCFEISP